MLRTSEPISFNLQGDSGTRKVVLRWPTDEEWIRRWQVLRSGDEVRAAWDLIEAIRTDGGKVQLSTDDVLLLSDVLSSGRIIERTATDGLGEIAVSVFGVAGIPALACRHTLTRPAYRVLRDLARGNRVQELLLDLGACGAMYDSLLQRNEGYDGPVPLIHKHSVVWELFERLTQQPAVSLAKGA